MFAFNPGFPPVPSPIRSVQYGTVALGTTTSGTAGITSVNTAKTSLQWLGQSMSGTVTDFEIIGCRMTLTNATTVTVVRQAGGSSPTVSFVAVEFV